MHRLTEIDPESRQATCSECGPTIITKNGQINGRTRWRCKGLPRVRNTHEKYSSKQRRYVKFKGDHCKRCGFIPEDSCQLDIHHKDCNKVNNVPENLETICANCHRLQTKKERAGGS